MARKKGFLSLITSGLKLAEYITRPGRCSICGNSIKKAYHTWTIGGKTQIACPNCNRRLESGNSRAAMTSGLAPSAPPPGPSENYAPTWKESTWDWFCNTRDSTPLFLIFFAGLALMFVAPAIWASLVGQPEAKIDHKPQTPAITWAKSGPGAKPGDAELASILASISTRAPVEDTKGRSAAEAFAFKAGQKIADVDKAIGPGKVKRKTGKVEEWSFSGGVTVFVKGGKVIGWSRPTNAADDTAYREGIAKKHAPTESSDEVMARLQREGKLRGAVVPPPAPAPVVFAVPSFDSSYSARSDYSNYGSQLPAYSYSGGGGGTVSVRGYTRKDGTHVSGYTRRKGR